MRACEQTTPTTTPRCRPRMRHTVAPDSFGRARRLLLVVGLVLCGPFAGSAQAAQVGVGPDTSIGTDSETAARTVALEKAAGVRYAREGAGWFLAQPDPDGPFSEEYEHALDRIVQNDLAAGIKPVMLISHPPYWASADPDKYTDGAGRQHWDMYYKPADLQAYARFVNYIVDRYSRMGVQHYEIWNEPNLDAFWPAGVDAADYTQLLNAAYDAAKQADQDSIVIAAGVANDPNAYEYADALYRAGAKFDRFNYHVYPMSEPGDCWSDDGSHKSVNAFCSIEEIRKVMIAHGDSRPMWLTEFGYSACAEEDDPTHACYTEEEQASALTASFEALDADYPYVEAASWGNFRDIAEGPWPDWYAKLGVLRRDFSERPAYEALKRYATSKTVDVGVPLNVGLVGDGRGEVSVTSGLGRIDCGVDCSRDYVLGTAVTLRATPAPGSTFGRWQGGGCGSAATCTVTVRQALNLKALFTLEAETDVKAPNTTITHVPRSGKRAGTIFRFRFRSTERKSTFLCKLDRGKFKVCRQGPPNARGTSSRKVDLAILARGRHRFAVRAIDRAGNEDPTPATSTFEVTR